MLDQKTKKYDRQLRLWQAHGQLALESAKVLVLGADACGTELLKNLVLPGKGERGREEGREEGRERARDGIV